ILKNLDTRLFSSVGGQEVKPGLALRRHFARQVLARVDFVAMIRSMAAACDILIEVGPGRVLSGLVHDITGADGPPCIPVESFTSRDEDLNTLLARLFIQGVHVRWEALYEARLIRPFTPPSERVFIENPCERPFGISDATHDCACILSGDTPADLLADLVQLSPAELNAYLKARGAFLAEVIQADLKHSTPPEFAGTLEFKAPQVRTNRPERAGPAPEMPPAPHTREEMEARLLSLAAEITGFTRESLDLSMRLLDDLNLDSIKAGDLIGKAQKAMGLEGEIEPLDFANANLSRILDKLMELAGKTPLESPERTKIDPLGIILDQAAEITSLPRESLDADALVGRDFGLGLDQVKALLRRSASLLNVEANVDPGPLLQRSLRQIAAILERLALKQTPRPSLLGEGQLDSWVREFAVELVEEPFPALPEWWGKRREDDWRAAKVLILSGPDTTEVPEALRDSFLLHGAQVQTAGFAEAKQQALATDIAYTHLIAVLPRTPSTYEANEADLQKVVERLASVLPSPPASQAPRRRTTVVYIQFGGGFLGSRLRVSDLNPCCATALAKSLHLERSDLRVRVLDFFPFLDTEKIAEKAFEEINTPDSFAAVGFDRKLRRRISRQRLVQPASYKPRAAEWSGEDVILVTGGAKGITAACALGVAMATGARMALVGRSPHPSDYSEDAESREIAETLQKYADQGVVARYFSCDVSDLDAVAALVAQIRQEMGPISGVIHGAGLNHPRPANQVSVKDAMQEVSPKIMGALNLLFVLEDIPPKIFVGLSSIIAVTGMPGNAWYGFSNESLDVILRRFEADHPETQTLAVAFSIWRDEGMGARMGSVQRLKRMGVDAIPTEEGVRRFVRLFLHDPGVPQVIVSARLGGLDTWFIEPFTAALNARYLEEPLFITPGVESVFQAHLTLERDPYLKDHVFNGSYLFPAVFGLEAMAQVAAHATGERDFRRVRIEDIKLERPITVDPQEGADIVVWAQVEERQSESDKLKVRAGITKPRTGVKTDFFSAIFVLGLADEPPEYGIKVPTQPLGIQPQPDLYRDTLLFQGPLFQRLQSIWELGAKDEMAEKVVFSSKLEEISAVEKKAFPCHAHGTLFLGDPFFRDSLLQSAQLLVPRETCLPVSIGCLEIYPSEGKAPNSLLARAELNHLEAMHIESAVIVVDDNGRCREKLEGYSLKILKHHDGRPSAADLISPDERDNRIVHQTIKSLSERLEFRAPSVLFNYLPGLHHLTREDRHARELPLLRKAVIQALEEHPDTLPNFDVEWLDSGKPIVTGLAENNIQISLSHDDRLCFCAAGLGPQGCDVAPIAHRTREEWDALLGQGRDHLLEALGRETDSIDRAGTRVWSALETLRKVTGESPGQMEIAKKNSDVVLFQSETYDDPILIVTLPLNLTWGPERILALTVPAILPSESDALPYGSTGYDGYSDLFELRSFDTLKAGPQGQGMFVHRFPVTFKANAQLTRTVYFANYFFWLGEIREASLWPVLGRVARQFSTGKWGLVTNNLHMHILGETTARDQVEIRMWVAGNGGPANSTMDLTFDFRRIIAPGCYERLAW
ncbi:MAG: SDR family NAD(P)-dependent oxidoreductase, partial [Desulfobacterales bacterium]